MQTQISILMSARAFDVCRMQTAVPGSGVMNSGRLQLNVEAEVE
jgi:hypothetical protein